MATSTSIPGNSTAAGIASTLGANDTMDRVVQSAHAAVDRLAEKAGPAVDRLRSGLSSASETLQSGAQEFGAMQEKWVENTRSYVREHPLAAVGIAVAAGIVLSRLLSNERD